ncbi:phytanoyl-CoA dioxygenase family protein [Jannaschia sp. CCS1]|uniref:phytanoyl-CoA dioxygenase family protein n=1 Tax=Jannaschia sp. (strain CCS1) TaxID=290400 RepID=UPI000053AED0|nr:phytanoyl-CoA dioxygenase family protein [Jannaschia sp. CCS1]ABD54345.1 Phytanoyl-CoA dioxygenase [Jannaschia sp. CCS1]
MGGGYYDGGSGTLEEFAALCARALDPAQVPFAAGVEANIPIYDMPALAGGVSADPAQRRALMAEWAWVLGQASGTLVLRQAQPDHGAIDRASDVFDQIITDEAAGGAKADHFAAAGANSRIWNALEKHCLADPEGFARYYGAPGVEAVAEAWLGPAFQMTAQVNVVRPGGQAQVAHRDYHLGFQTAEVAAQFPPHVHELSQVMTLQGALAHCDMPLDSGPTKLLPFSQLFAEGYMAYRRPDFAAFFEDHYVQMPLEKGDGLFFNPALFHGAGANTSRDIQRMANLLQVSSAFGRAMEAIDRRAMCKALYPVIGCVDGARRRAAIACAAEGYAFPTNLDTDPPSGGLAPESMAQLFRRALQEGMVPEQFNAALDAQAERRNGG